MKKLISLVILMLLGVSANAFQIKKNADPDTINDGPFISGKANKLHVQWVENNRFYSKSVNQETFPSVKEKFNLLFEFTDIKESYNTEPEFNQVFKGVDSIAAITDIHGQFDSYIKLLKAAGVIDANLNWKFGKGHLVVLGDCFDRGDKVTELLWHLFGLEKQAARAGGMVHMILGNHESLFLRNDRRYMNRKYSLVEEITGIFYYDLLSKETVLGNWVRTFPIILSINDIVFVHGGLSIAAVNRNMSVTMINKTFSKMELGMALQSDEELDDLIFLNNKSGPIWYRGFFTDTAFCESKIDSILNFYHTKHIIVGHTISSEIKPRFDNKIIGIDAGISENMPGAVLIYKNGSFYKSSVSGQRIKL